VKKKSFRYEVGWLKEKEHGVLIKKAWQEGQLQGDHWGKVQGGLNRCKRTLKLWARRNDNQGEAKIKEVYQRLHAIQMEDSRVNNEEGKLQSKLNTLLEQEELKWKQRAREDVLKFGDRNTKFFHTCANQKTQRKLISRIMDKEGRS
jgi:predicted nuclease with TOPRIM domain